MGGWWPEKKVEREEPRMRKEEIMGGPGSVPEFLKKKEEKMIEEPRREEKKVEKAPEAKKDEKSPDAEKAKDDANAAKEKVKTAAAAPKTPEKPKGDGPEAIKEGALKKASEAIKGES